MLPALDDGLEVVDRGHELLKNIGHQELDDLVTGWTLLTRLALLLFALGAVPDTVAPHDDEVDAILVL